LLKKTFFRNSNGEIKKTYASLKNAFNVFVRKFTIQQTYDNHYEFVKLARKLERTSSKVIFLTVALT